MAKQARSFENVTAVAQALKPSYPVYCLRPKLLQKTARRFMTLFPGTVLYAVKCNPHPMVLGALYGAGLRHFDTASLPEIAQIHEAFTDAHAYFMHPVKSRAAIQSTYKVFGVRHFVVDHMNELDKVTEETRGDNEVVIIVRIYTPPSKDALYHLAAKFGANRDEAVALLKEAQRRGCKTGIAFHVGSQCRDPKVYREALQSVGAVIEASGVSPACIDVGGGFPAEYLNMKAPAIELFMDEIRAGLKEIKVNPTVDIFAEPGRALVASGVSLLVQVQLRKEDQLYINDGIYGSLSEMVQAGVRLPARLVRLDGEVSESMKGFKLNGPTCDSLDVLPGAFQLPADVREGDWIEIDQVGAYSNALATHFNGFFPETYVEVHDEPPAFTVATEGS